mgnify:CR=1 FL=1
MRKPKPNLACVRPGLGRAFSCALFLGACFLVSPARAQDLRPSQSALEALSPVTGVNREEGMAVADWMVYPSLFVGGVFNDNIYAVATHRRVGAGLRLRPALEANRDAGLHRSSIYFSADMQFYPGVNGRWRYAPTLTREHDPTSISARAGAIHVWTPMPDLKVTVSGDYTRQAGLFGSSFGAAAPLVYVTGGAPVGGAHRFSNQFTGHVSVEKEITDRLFVRGAATAQYILYDRRPSDSFGGLPGVGFNGFNASSDAQSGVNVTGSLRAGYWITPQLYAFVEPAAEARRYRTALYDTNGYRILAGVGSDLISLFRGEIHAGWQRQSSVRGAFAGAASPTVGARLFYYPTQYLTLSATVDHTLTSAGAPVGNFGAAATGALSPWLASAGGRTLQMRAQVDYAFSPDWSAFARAGYGQTRWSQWGRRDVAWSAGAGMSYSFWRNVALTLEYQVTRTASGNVWLASLWGAGAAAGYVQNIASVGLTYRY